MVCDEDVALKAKFKTFKHQPFTLNKRVPPKHEEDSIIKKGYQLSIVKTKLNCVKKCKNETNQLTWENNEH